MYFLSVVWKKDIYRFIVLLPISRGERHIINVISSGKIQNFSWSPFSKQVLYNCSSIYVCVYYYMKKEVLPILSFSYCNLYMKLCLKIYLMLLKLLKKLTLLFYMLSFTSCIAFSIKNLYNKSLDTVAHSVKYSK